jgi:tRNA threonylcarbamoyladenosine biosynthesis protein TsaB
VTVLGIDTSTSATAVALRAADGGQAIEARDDPAAGAHPGHATRLLAMTDELLAAAGLTLAEVRRIAVGAGPGTFTGLRVGIATARALAQSLGAELVSVSSLAALASPALAEGDGRAVLAVIDARRREVFAAPYSRAEGLLAAQRAIAPAEIATLLDAAGLAAATPLGVGDGALRYRAELEAAGVEVPPEDSGLHLLRAGAVCELAGDAATGDYAEVLPAYLRRPDAELALEGAAPGAAA